MEQMEEEQLAVAVSAEGDFFTLSACGEIDAASVPVLKAALEQATTDLRRTVVVDLSGVTFMDSSGLGVLAGTHTALANGGGKLVLRGGVGMIPRLLAISGLDRVICVEDR